MTLAYLTPHFVAALAVTLAGCSTSPPATSEIPEVRSATNDVSDSTPMGIRMIGCFAGPEDSSASTPTYDFNVKLTIAEDGASLTIDGRERDTESRRRFEWTTSEPVLGAVIERTSMRTTNDWYIALRLPNGDVRIERWQLEHTYGTRYSELAESCIGIGASVVTPQLVESVEGDRFVEPSRRPKPRISRTTLVPSVPLGFISKMLVDPDARYLITEHQSEGRSTPIVQIVLVASLNPPIDIGDVFALWDAPRMPEYEGDTIFSLLEHPTKGRAFISGNVLRKVYLWDKTNDGVFETSEILADFSAYVVYPIECWSRSF